jgi:hypothetical protein
MSRVKLTKTVIDALPIPSKDIVHWDTGCPERLFQEMFESNDSFLSFDVCSWTPNSR